jgi:zinc/manganese transport system ATP-binding protein
VNPLLGVMDRVLYITNGKAAIGAVEEVVNNEKLSWLYNSPIKVLKQGNYVFVLHEKMGSNIHAHDHSSC